MKPEKILLSKETQTHKDKRHMVSLILGVCFPDMNKYPGATTEQGN